MTRAMHLQQVKNKARYFKPKSSAAVREAVNKFKRANGIVDFYDPAAIHNATPNTVIQIRRGAPVDYRAMQNREPVSLEWAETVSTPESRNDTGPWIGVILGLILALVACAFAAYWWA